MIFRHTEAGVSIIHVDLSPITQKAIRFFKHVDTQDESLSIIARKDGSTVAVIYIRGGIASRRAIPFTLKFETVDGHSQAVDMAVMVVTSTGDV